MRIPRLAAAAVAPAFTAVVLVVLPAGAARAASPADPNVAAPIGLSQAGVIQAAMSADPALTGAGDNADNAGTAGTADTTGVPPASAATGCGTDSAMNGYISEVFVQGAGDDALVPGMLTC